MDYLDVSYNAPLVIVSFLVALVAGFTGLTLTKDLSRRSVAQRKTAIAMASVALGGGIWSMHFVAMLGMQLPVLFYYDAAITLISALVAILIVAIALSMLHFTERTGTTLTMAGGIIATGILTMHYIGMAGLQLCRAIYTPTGIAAAVVASFALCIAAIWVAYGNRTNRNILLGTFCFGSAVVAVHYVAMAGTGFVAIEGFNEFGPVISNEVLALGVIVSVFVICGAFLWMGVTFVLPEGQSSQSVALVAEDPVEALRTAPKIPCEKDGRTLFVELKDVVFVRAEGHYSQVFTESHQCFCTWPITEVTERLVPHGFLKVHRSYLVNPAHVESFERLKDTGLCRFVATGLPPVPVSRSNLRAVREALGL
jgi:NO-binding membrane sensor protein with MHYT domain